MLRGVSNVPILFSSSGPTPLAEDDFSGTLSNWAQDSSTWSISGGELQASVVGGATGFLRWTGGGVTIDDYAVECDIYCADGGNPAGIGVRGSAGVSGYFARISRGFNDIIFMRLAGGGYNGVASTPGTAPAPSVGWHTFRMECEGTALRLYQDGTLILSATDSHIASGVPFIHAYSTADNARWDNFKVYAL